MFERDPGLFIIVSAKYRQALDVVSPGPPLFLLNDTHQRSKNAKKGVLLGILRMSLKLKKKGVVFQHKLLDF